MRGIKLAGLALAACSPDRIDDRLNVRTDGAVLPVEVHGNIGSGTLLLVESGGPSGPAIAQRAIGWMPFQDTLEPEMAVALYDRRGTGNATGDYGVDDQSVDHLVEDLHAVILALHARYQPERLVLMGHSFGAYTSALVQLEHPGAADAWIAAAPAILEGPDDLYVPYRRDFACRVAADQLAAGETADLWLDIEAFCAANPTMPADRDTPEADALWGYLDQIEDRLEPWPAMRAGGVLGAAFASQYNILDAQPRGNRISDRIVAEPGREDLLPELGGIGVPTTVVTGELDGTAPTELGAAIAGAVGGTVAHVEIPGGGHYPMADDPEAFAEAVTALVDGL